MRLCNILPFQPSICLDFRCPSKIRYGLGPVPDSYYVDVHTALSDYDQLTTVYAGDKHLIELKVKANTRVR